jgi:SpoIID/LytB domain protein
MPITVETCARRMRTLAAALTVAVLVGVLAPPPARAATRVRVRGGGWGHGIGMSQYGAFGRARNGQGATRILEHYYTRANVRRANLPRRIRVGLLQYRSAISSSSEVFSSGEGRIVFKVNGRRLAAGRDATRWRVEPSSTGGMRLYKNGNRVRRDGRSVFGSPSSPLTAEYERFGSKLRISEKGTSYAYGRMQFGTYSTPRCGHDFCLRLVLSLPMQKYLYGLGEVPSSWPQATLRAQAIAGRTYAFEKVRRSGQHRYPCNCAVYDSTIDQAYIGDAKRTGSGPYWDDWKRAVDGTRSQVILYRGNPIQALYSSSSGGHTENNENVWGGAPIPYLRGVRDRPDRVSANPNHTWSVSMRWRAFENKLQAAYGIGDLRAFRLVRPFGVSGRVTVVKPDGTGGVRIRGSRKTVRVSGWSVRSALGLKDTLFRVDIVRTTATSRTVPGVWEVAYRRVGGSEGELGQPLRRRRTTSALPGGGRQLRFTGGTLYLNPELDSVVALWGRLDAAYRRMGQAGSACGYPVSDVETVEDGRQASFENGTITVTTNGIEVACG